LNEKLSDTRRKGAVTLLEFLTTVRTALRTAVRTASVTAP